MQMNSAARCKPTEIISTSFCPSNTILMFFNSHPKAPCCLQHHQHDRLQLHSLCCRCLHLRCQCIQRAVQPHHSRGGGQQVQLRGAHREARVRRQELLQELRYRHAEVQVCCCGTRLACTQVGAFTYIGNIQSSAIMPSRHHLVEGAKRSKGFNNST